MEPSLRKAATDAYLSSLFGHPQIVLDLHLPQSKRFKRTIELYGPVDPVASSYKFFGTKVRYNVLDYSLQLVVEQW